MRFSFLNLNYIYVNNYYFKLLKLIILIFFRRKILLLRDSVKIIFFEILICCMNKGQQNLFYFWKRKINSVGIIKQDVLGYYYLEQFVVIQIQKLDSLEFNFSKYNNFVILGK